jgi:4-amino-4-deoxy-L-arabinose transferase-like glycosyltransferase
MFASLVRFAQGPWALALLFVTALAARVAATPFLGDLSQSAGLWEYGEQALCAAQTGGDLCLRDQAGNAYASALMPPLTSYLWLGLFKLFGVGEAARIAYVALNILAGAACAPLLMLAARRMGMEPLPAFLSGALLAVYPTFIAVSTGYHATNFTILLTLAFVIVFMRAAETLGWANALLAGALAGLSVLTRNELLLVAAGSAALLVWIGRKRLAAGVRAAAALTIGVALVMSPWIVRNYVTFNHFIPVGAQAGYNLWIGFGPYARGSGNSLDNDPEARAAAAAIRARVAPGDSPEDRFEPRLQDAFLTEALPVIEQGGIGRIVSLTVQKFVLLWLFDWTDPITHSPAYWGPWLLAHVLALYGVTALWRRRATMLPNAILLTLLFLAVFSFAYSVSSVFARYRMHMEPFIFLFSGLGGAALLQHLAAINPAGRRLRT